MKTHPFEPLVFEETKKLIIGTLPPETAPFYFSNDRNTRLWDLLFSIDKDFSEISTNSNNLEREAKCEILKRLNLGIADIIYKYDREVNSSTKDDDIIPKEYKNIIEIAENSNINEFLFVYQNAYKWFLHSLSKQYPVKTRNLNNQKYQIGFLQNIKFKSKEINCYLLPSPLNRGRKGETLLFKLDFYRKLILNK